MDDIKSQNFNDDDYMHALTKELDFIIVVVDNVLQNRHILVYTYRNGSHRVSVEYFKSLYVFKLRVFLSKVRRISNSMNF